MSAYPPPLWLKSLAQVSRKLGAIPGMWRLLRILHSPDKRDKWHLKDLAPALYSNALFEVETNSYVEWQIFFFSTLDISVHTWICKNVQPDWVVFDVGANIGFFSVLLSQRSYECHSFEPNIQLKDKFSKNLELNNIGNCRLVEVALSNKTGTTRFHLVPRENNNKGVSSLIRDTSGPIIDVPIMKLDEYVCEAELKRLDFIKMDVEGAESLVLSAATETLTKMRPAIIFETVLGNREQCISILEESDYLITRLDGSSIDAEYENAPDLLAIPREKHQNFRM